MPEIRSLTSIRGIAALWIVLHHFWPQTNGQTPYVIAKGYMAVDLFFILSGMVLYLVYSQALQSGQFDLKQFLFKRFARLYPVHLVTMILAVIVLSAGPWLGFSGREQPYDLSQMVLLHLTLLHAWGLTETGGLNYPSWSISAETFAYLLFPILAYFTLKSRSALIWATAILIAILIGTQLYWPQGLRNPDDSMVFTRLENDFGVLRILPEFLLGLAIAKQAQSVRTGWLLIFVGLAFICLGLFSDLDALVLVGFAGILWWCLEADPKTPPFLHKLGEISYSIYMSHALVQIIGFKLIETYFGYDDGAVPTMFILPMLLLTILVAVGLFLGCEQPARRWLLTFSAPKFDRAKVVRSCSM